MKRLRFQCELYGAPAVLSCPLTPILLDTLYSNVAIGKGVQRNDRNHLDPQASQQASAYFPGKMQHNSS